MAVNITPQSQLTVGAPNQGEAHNTNVSRANANDQALADAVSSLTGAGLVRTVTVGSAKLNPDGSGNVTLPGGVVFPPMTTAQRNAIASPTIGQGIYNTSLARPEMRSASGWVPLSVLVEVFTTSATWTKTLGAKLVTAIVIGGGASGAAVSQNTQYLAASGGAGGARAVQTLLADALGASASITVGSGGAQRSAVNGDSLQGSNPGGSSAFGPFTVQGGGQQADATSPAASAQGGNGLPQTSGGGNHRALGPGGGAGASRGYGADSYSGGSPAGTSGVSRSGSGVGGDGGSTGQAGSVPGGGGGAAANNDGVNGATSGAGARGEVIVITQF